MHPTNEKHVQIISVENFLKISFPLLIILGVVNLTSYYYQFNLPILSYLSFTEIITLFLENIIYYLFLLVPGFMVLGIGKEKNNNSVLLGLGVVYFIVFIIILINERLAFSGWKIYNGLLLLIVYVPSFFLIKLIRREIVKEINRAKIYLYSWAILFFVGSLFITSIVGFMNANDVKRHHIFSGTEIILMGKTIISNDSLYFIGKTENYIFLYDEIKGGPIIYPIKDLDQILLKSKKIQRGMESPNNPPQSP